MATTIEELDRRVTALEKAQRETAETQQWMAATLGRVASVQDQHTQRLDRIEAVQDQHTQRLGRIEAVQGQHTQRLDRIEADVKGLRSDLPSIVANALREVLKER